MEKAYEGGERDFNSIMVRLKVKDADEIVICDTFQFHYGTIKRRLQRWTSQNVIISIPLWYD